MFKSILKVNLLSLFYSMFNGKKGGSNSKKRSKAVKALIAVFAVYIVGVLMLSVGAMFSTLASGLNAAGMNWLYFSVTSIFIFLLTFIGSVFTTQNLIFNAKDNELLLGMPIPPFYILASRVMLLFILNLIYGVLMAVPAIVVYFFYAPFSAATLLLFIASSLLIVIFSSAVTSFLGWLIALISSRFRNKNIIQIILSLLLFGAYMVFATNIQTYMQKLIVNGEAIAQAIRKAMPPFYYFGLACAEHKAWAFAALAAVSIIPFLLACLLLSKSFFTITAAKKTAAKKKYVEKELKTSSVRSALLRKEFGRFFSLPIYVLNSAAGCLMHIIFSVMIIVKGKELIASFAEMGEIDVAKNLPVIICLVMGLCSSMVNLSSASTSLEGSRINLIRSMPINSDDFFFAKYASNYIVGLPTLLIGSLVVCITLGISASVTAVIIVTLLLFFAVTVFVNLISNICLPRFTWNSEAVIIKQGGSVLVGMLGGLAATVTVFAPFFLLSKYISSEIYLLFASVLSAVLCLVFFRVVKTFGKTKFEQMNA